MAEQQTLAVLAGTELVLWLDRARDNAPLAEAVIEAESGAWKGVATPAADGSLRLVNDPDDRQQRCDGHATTFIGRLRVQDDSGETP